MLKVTKEILCELASNVQNVTVYFTQDRFDKLSLGFRFFEFENKEYFNWFTDAVEITAENRSMFEELKSLIQECSYQDIIVWDKDYDLFIEKYRTGLGFNYV